MSIGELLILLSLANITIVMINNFNNKKKSLKETNSILKNILNELKNKK